MPSRPHPLPTLSLGPGGEYHLVPATQVLRWDEETAYASLRDAMADDGATARELADFAESRGCPAREAEAVARHLAREIAAGALAPIVLEEAHPAVMRPVMRGDQPRVDWDDIRPLSDLIRTDPVEPTWVSFEVLDHVGVPLVGLALTLVHGDGRRDEIVLDAAGRHRCADVAAAGAVTVYWPARIQQTDPSKLLPGLDGFRRGGADLSVPREPKGAALRLPQTARHYRIVVEAPPLQPTVSYPSSIFASDSALPTHAVDDLGRRAQELAARDASARFGLFAHTDARDDADANKQLADRRARAVFGLLTDDWEAFRDAVQDEALPTEAYQMMLRVLGCNPTAIDGETGQQTALAVAAFRRGYNAVTWHVGARARAYGELPDGDALDDATRRALLDAYHAELSFRLPPERFIGPKHMGCGEFNPLGDDDADHRRVTLTIYGAEAPRDDEFPCRHGDAGACWVDGGGRFSCRFYRERIAEQDVEHELTPFWDFEWMKTSSGKAHLSALTHLPDTNEATFVVRLVPGGRQPLEDSGHGAAPGHGEALVSLPGLVRSGVAYALWDHGPKYDPFDGEHWFRRYEDEPGHWPLVFMPPVFTVESDGRWGYGDAPGARPPRVRAGSVPTFVVQRANGEILRVASLAALHALAEGERIVAITVAGHRVAAGSAAKKEGGGHG